MENNTLTVTLALVRALRPGATIRVPDEATAARVERAILHLRPDLEGRIALAVGVRSARGGSRG